MWALICVCIVARGVGSERIVLNVFNFCDTLHFYTDYLILVCSFRGGGGLCLTFSASVARIPHLCFVSCYVLLYLGNSHN